MSFIIDLLSIGSLVGIWPRYIEPRRLKITQLNWQLDPSSHHLAGLKIIHLTDLHFHEKTSQSFLDKIIRNIHSLEPDLILFTGDFLCYSTLADPARFLAFLCRLKAPLGSYCTFGNHDYAQYVSLNRQGIYEALSPPRPLTGFIRALRTLFSHQKISTQTSPYVSSIALHDKLCHLLNDSPFKLLENTTLFLPIGLNLTGLGDLALGRCSPNKAFLGYNLKYPGIVLSHNPDSFPTLLNFPGNWILCGHTHGEQIHIPWPKWGRKISMKLARLENSEYTRGLFELGEKRLYVNRGLGSHKPFRLFSPPEICLIKAVKND